MIDRNQTRIVSAAIRFKDGLIICGPTMVAVIQALKLVVKDPNVSVCEQGFITNKQTFLSREDAWIVAATAGQIREQTGTYGVLYSEDLY